MNTASTKSAITFLDGERGILRYRGIPIEELAEKSTFVEVSYLLIYGHLPNKTELANVLAGADPSLDVARGHEALLRRLPGHRPPDGDPVGDGAVAVQLLPAGARREEQGRAGGDHRAPAVEDADHRRVLLQEVDRPAVRLPEEQPFLLRELPQHDVLGSGRTVRNRRGNRQGPEPAADPARRPRAELQHVDGAPGRQLAGQPVRVDLGRHLRALGPAARRRQRRGADDAAVDQGRRRRPEEVRRPRQEEGLGLPADGLRPPRLQELRPAREDHQGRGRQGHEEDEDAGPAARHRQDAGRGGAVRPVLHRAQAVPERRLLQRHHLPRARHPDEHVHGDVRHRPHAGLDRALERDDGGPDHEDLPPAADLHGPAADPLRPDRRARSSAQARRPRLPRPAKRGEG